MTRQLIDDCFLSDKDRLTHREALNILQSNTKPLTSVETVPLDQASGKFLAQDISAERPIPAHDNAAVDGYSFNFADYDSENGSALKLTGRSAAGDPQIKTIKTGATTRILTGAIMPVTHDTVVMQEDVYLEDRGSEGTFINIPPGLKHSANHRRAGEDTKPGDILVKKGEQLKPQHIAVIASGGFGEVNVFKPISIAQFSTGDEIIRPGEPFEMGNVFDANGPMLQGLTRNQTNNVTDLGILKDDAETIKTAIKNAADNHHILITSGGASKGEEDHIVKSLEELGTCHMWQLAIKPGRPMTFGQIGDTVFIGLPGNPVAAFVCYLLYVSPLIKRLSGGEWHEPHRYQVPANFEIKSKKPDRREFLRGNLIQEDGIMKVQKYGQDGSGLIRSLTLSDGLIELDEQTTSLKLGEPVSFIPFSEFGL